MDTQKLRNILAGEGLIKLGSAQKRILKLIVDGALEERNVLRLVGAYVDAMEEDWLDASDGGAWPEWSTTADMRAWKKKHFGMVYDSREAELALQAAYVPIYLKLVRGADKGNALEVLEYPQGFPDKDLPRAVIQAVGAAMAKRDAADAVALYEYAQKHRQQ